MIENKENKKVEDIIERYIYTVTKSMPDKIKEDVSNEIRTLIDDIIKERFSNSEYKLNDIKNILMEIGNPYELAYKYNTDYNKCLIGYPYYIYYKLILKIVLSSTLLGIVASSIINIFINNEVLNLINIASNIFTALLLAFSFVTLIFVLISNKIDISSFIIDFDNLQKPPNKKINFNTSIIKISAAIIFLLLLLLSPNLFSIKIDNEYLAFFNTDIIKDTFLFPLIFILMLISREIIKMFSNAYNKKTYTFFISIDIVSAIVSSLWLLSYNVINNNFINTLTKLESDNFITFNIFNNFQLFCLIFILFALLIDSIYVILKLKNSLAYKG
ncbi:hypothetical protein [uncultured Brachyspira sp.]|uniref:hypothetical protein n=1 Tax=uncultured Brachyspira sp. TaxID=221953 RepID=UPI002633A747|nr:hypothetical protein [uncultured Brachyspira sp.]